MDDFAVRPWGRLHWVLDRLNVTEWSLYGCVATEERWCTVLNLLQRRDAVSRPRLLDIRGPDGHPQQALVDQRKSEELARALQMVEPDAIEKHDLLERNDSIVKSVLAFAQESSNVILDITALPKRFFFPALKLLLRQKELQNIVVTYAPAERYADALHEDALPPAFLPLFAPSAAAIDDSPDMLVVGLGFDAPGLMQILETGDVTYVEVLVPYPAAPPFGRRNWDFLRRAWPSIDPNRCKLVEVSAVDAPSCYTTICAATESANKRVILAPYGPKPLSLAMGLYAQGLGSDTAAIMYTQPKYYHPEYSLGVGKDHGEDVIYAYPIRLAGSDLY